MRSSEENVNNSVFGWKLSIYCQLSKNVLSTKKVDENNCSFSSDQNIDVQDVTSANDDSDVVQAHRNVNEEASNSSFVFDDV